MSGMRLPRVGALVAAAVGVTGCGSVAVRVGVTASGVECQRDFGSSTAAAKIETFLAATTALERFVVEEEASLARTCEAMGRDAGLPSDPAPSLDTCRGLLVWLDAERAALGVTTQTEVPECVLSMDAYAQCVSSCELRYRPSEVEVQCVGAVEGRTCSQGLRSPQAGPRCRASCETRAELDARCVPRGASLASARSASAVPADESRAARLAEVWATHGPALRLSRARLERIGSAASQLLAIAPVLPEAAATVSIRAVACATDAAGAAASASAHLEVTRGLARRLAPDAPSTPAGETPSASTDAFETPQLR
ncbi:MAG: hypothetical protein OHK0013_04310 [Sandaracinaceae bacterium]